MADIFLELRKNAERIPASLAFASADGHLNYQLLLKNIDAVAAQATEVGIRPGQTILVDCSADDIRLMLVLGLMRVGAVVGFGKTMTRFAEHGARVDAVITEDAKLSWSGRVFRLSPRWFQGGTPRPAAGARDYALIISSSGSIGKPKLIKFSKKNIDYRSQTKFNDEYFSEIPRYYSTSGNTTATTLIDFFVTLMKGGVVIHTSRRSPNDVLNTIDLFRPNYVSMAPGMLVRILRLLREQPRQFERVDYIRLNGAYCSIKTREECLKEFAREVLISFGATEISRVAWGKLSDHRADEGSIGRIIEGVQAETVDDAGNPLPTGSEGEIRIRPPRAAVTSYLSAEGERSPLRDGWFYPGDIGRIDADGNLIVTGRKSLVINLGGNKISPEVAESVLQGMDGVEDAGVLGVKDHNGFEVVCALIVKNKDVTLDGINRFLGSTGNNYSVSKLKFVPAIPRAESGKVDRDKLREIAA